MSVKDPLFFQISTPPVTRSLALNPAERRRWRAGRPRAMSGFCKDQHAVTQRCINHTTAGGSFLRYLYNNNDVAINLPQQSVTLIVSPNKAYLVNCCSDTGLCRQTGCVFMAGISASGRLYVFHFLHPTCFRPKERKEKKKKMEVRLNNQLPTGRYFFVFQQETVCFTHGSDRLWVPLNENFSCLSSFVRNVNQRMKEFLCGLPGDLSVSLACIFILFKKNIPQQFVTQNYKI